MKNSFLFINTLSIGSTLIANSSIKIQKRKLEEDEEEVFVKHQKTEKLRHCIISTKYVPKNSVHQLFDNIRLCTVDPPVVSNQGKVVDRHIHLIATPRIFKRAARDIFEKIGITIDKLRVAINAIHYDEIKDAYHFNNLTIKLWLIDQQGQKY
ncbi:hypothetical protein BpHYR1_026685 [Brachionus plicatilis]|uniref:Uncharacterized protein n=1 Tax=Brachionus plicatilis TaxID=10195 RepID=A0A3M7RUQ5_BRAPC|nr:hypothetical protein BpHYR1_026685 [Brachionus plicatilis]